jgi:hypothetical protein
LHAFFPDIWKKKNNLLIYLLVYPLENWKLDYSRSLKIIVKFVEILTIMSRSTQVDILFIAQDFYCKYT